MRNASSPIPVFVTDDWDAFEEGLINVYGKIELPQYKGIGRKPLPKLTPVEDLKYIKVLKKKVKGYVVEAIQHIIFGDPEKNIQDARSQVRQLHWYFIRRKDKSYN